MPSTTYANQRKSPPDLIREPVADQPPLFEQLDRDQVVNVASVPKRSPFRYPGGKTWLVPYVREWLRNRSAKPTELIEPFAGGAIVSLTAIFEDLVDEATLVELDEDIVAVWQTILEGEGEWLANEILGFDIDPDTVENALLIAPRTTCGRAFATILRNRVSRGGILAPGAGLIKNGENGKGLLSRWYPDTLSKRILDIASRRQRFSVVHGDGIQVMRECAHVGAAVFFIDPPYTVAGRRLYTHCEVDHQELFEAAAKLKGDFLMTYDETEEIRGLAKGQDFALSRVPMKNTHHEKKWELLISRDLSWLP